MEAQRKKIIPNLEPKIQSLIFKKVREIYQIAMIHSIEVHKKRKSKL